MRRDFVVCVLLTFCPCLSPLARGSAFNSEVQDVLYTIRRAAPPAAGASVEELERTGDQLRSEKAYLDALDYYQAALAKKPDNARVLNKRGIVELQMQHYKQARKDFEKAIKLDRTFASTYNNLGASLEFRFSKEWRLLTSVEPSLQSCHQDIGITATNPYQIGGDIRWEREF